MCRVMTTWLDKVDPTTAVGPVAKEYGRISTLYLKHAGAVAFLSHKMRLSQSSTVFGNPKKYVAMRGTDPTSAGKPWSDA